MLNKFVSYSAMSYNDSDATTCAMKGGVIMNVFFERDWSQLTAFTSCAG